MLGVNAARSCSAPTTVWESTVMDASRSMLEVRPTHLTGAQPKARFQRFQKNYEPSTSCCLHRSAHHALDLPSSASNSTSWNVGNFKEVQLAEEVEYVGRLVQQGTYVDHSRFYRLMKRCILRKDLVLGRRLHALIIRSGCESNAFLANHIICMYSSHGLVGEASQAFRKVAFPDPYMWASIILAHAKHGQPRGAVSLYRQVRQSTVKLDNRIFVSVLKACANAADLIAGKEVHADIVASGIKPDKFVGSCLVDMYAKCGELEDARKVFDTLTGKDVVTWNTMISGYAQRGLGQEALDLYELMQQEGITPADYVTFVCLLQACASSGDLHLGKQLHAQIQQRELDSGVVVANCLVDMYAKCGSLEDARKVFDAMPTKSVVTWTTMIASYAQHGLGKEALSLYSSMQQEGLTPPDHVTFASLFQACASVGALQQGMEIHSQMQETAALADVVVGTCLVDMYSKCGRLEDAREVFNTLPRKDVVTWNALLNGYAQNCDSQMALQCFHEMRRQGAKPNSATFICLLVACSHGGLVYEGHQCMAMMQEEYGIMPTVYHYNCMVDLLGRSGHLDDAEDVLRTMPVASDTVGWTSLLSACKSHGDIERGTRCFENLMRLEPESAAPYVLMASIYANAGRWGDADRIESMKQLEGAKKKPAKACIELNKEVHEFIVGDEKSCMSSKLRSINTRLREEGGHVPQTELVLKAVSEQAKEDALCGHAEKLALAYGLMNTEDGTPLLVTKNLRMCSDCHSSTKIMSQLEKREIVVRDVHRVHRFQNGNCSCGDLQ